jgi:hypothetical protein
MSLPGSKIRVIIHPPAAAIGNKERERWMETEEGEVGGREMGRV